MMRRNYFNIIFLCLVITISSLFSEKGIRLIKSMAEAETQNITIVLDAGHGGFDPGKVGVNKALEKDINLSIAYKLKRLLEE